MAFLPNIANWFGSTAPTVGQKAMASSIPMVVASDNYLNLVTDRPTVAARDAFQRLRTSEPVTIFDSKQIYDHQPLVWDDQQTSGSGTSGGAGNYSAANARTRMSVSNTTAGTRVRQTFQSFNYQPGKSQLIFMTFVAETGAAGITRRIGQFDANNGIFFEQAGTALSVNIRTQSANGAQGVAQASWNIDPLNGNGASGITLDMSKAQILVIDYEWLGVGSVRIGFVVNGIVYYAHQFRNANNIASVYMSTPNLPLRYEISNSGAGPAANLDHICSSVITEGGRSKLGQNFAIDTGTTPITLTSNDSEYLLCALRLATGRPGALVVPVSAAIATSAASGGAITMYRWRLIKNPTLTGTPTWVAVSNSSVETSVTGTVTVNAGTGQVLAAGSFTEVSNGITLPDLPEIALGMSIAGTSDVIVLAVTAVDGTAGTTAVATLGWNEVT